MRCFCKQERAEIRTLESHLRSLPDADWYGNVRRQMAQEISDAKSKINAAKPVGLRLESCRQALKRAEDRHAQADEHLKAAASAKEAALQEVTRLRTEVATIESELDSNSNSSSLGSAVGPETVQNAKAQMQKLFADLSALAGNCQQQVAQQTADQHAQQQAVATAAAQQQAHAQQQMWMQQQAVAHQQMLQQCAQVPLTPSGYVAASPVHMMVPSIMQQLQHGISTARTLQPQFNAAAAPQEGAAALMERSRSPARPSNGEGGVGS